jgi:hypothetical protein
MADAPTIDFDSLMAQPATPPSGGTIDFDSLMASSAPPAQSTGSGVVRNVGAGINESIAQTAGLPVDAITGAANLIGKGVNAGVRALGAKSDVYQPIVNPVGGSQSIERGMGLLGADPANVAATTPGQKIARSIGQGVGSMVVPGIGSEAALASGAADSLGPAAKGILGALRGSAETPATAGATAANVGRNALIGAGAGVGQGVAQQAAPPGYETLWGTAGALLGSAGPIGGEAAFRWAMSHPSVPTAAADRVVSNLSDPAQFQSKLNEPSQDLPGVTSTPAKITNDAGALQMENWARNQSPETFGASAAQDNTARATALKGVVPEAGLSPGQMVTQHLDALDAAQNAVETAAQARAAETMHGIGGGADTEDLGATARGQITSAYAPKIAAAQTAEGTAGAKLAGQVDRLGANAPTSDADTANQAYGEQLRGFVQQGKEARAAAESRLWGIAQQNGDLVFDHTPTQEAVGEARGMINPAGGDRLTPAEDALYGTIDKWDGPQDFDTIKAMRTNIGDATNTAFRSGDSRAGRRLMTVRSGLDSSIENAIDNRVAAENAAVKAGTLDPDDAMAAKLSDEAASWRETGSSQRPAASMGNAGQSNAGLLPDREAAIPGALGAEGQTTAGSVLSGRGEGLAQPLRPIEASPPAGEAAPGTTSQRYGAARAYTRETHGIFDDTPAGAVVARGPYGAPEKLPDSRVVSQFLNGRATEPEAVRNFEAATGGHQEAIDALHDAALFDLKRTAVNDAGQLNKAAFARWTKNHDGILSVYPELRQRVGDLSDAQAQLDQVQAQREQLTKQFTDAMGESNATVMSRYFRRGPAGADAMDAYARETGNTPAARDAMADHIANDLRASAAKDGTLNVPAYKRWLATNQPALSRRPDLLAKFDNAASAQDELAQAQATRTAAVKDFENGAAKFWLRTDPQTAVTNALSKRAGNNPVQNIRDLMGMAKGDDAAQAGIKQALRDWLVAKGVSGKEAGQTGTNWFRTQAMQDLIATNRPALAQAFSPQEMRTLDMLADSLKQADRSISGSKPPIGPGTARDIAASGRYGAAAQSLLSVVRRGAFRMGAMALGAHFAGAEGLIGSIVGSDALREAAGASGTAKDEAVKNLIIEALNSPAAMRTLLAHATPQNVESLSQQLARRLAQSSAAAAAKYAGGSAPP